MCRCGSFPSCLPQISNPLPSSFVSNTHGGGGSRCNQNRISQHQWDYGVDSGRRSSSKQCLTRGDFTGFGRSHKTWPSRELWPRSQTWKFDGNVFKLQFHCNNTVEIFVKFWKEKKVIALKVQTNNQLNSLVLRYSGVIMINLVFWFLQLYLPVQ